MEVVYRNANVLDPVMANKIRRIYSCGLNKVFGSKFSISSRVRHKTSEEGRRAQRPKPREYNNEGEDNNSNTLLDKNYLAYTKDIFKLKS